MTPSQRPAPHMLLILLGGLIALAATGCAPAPSMTAEQWDRQVLSSPVPVLVEFWRPGCPGCKDLTPQLQALVAEHLGKVAFYQINTDCTWDLVEPNSVRRLPAVLLFVDGKMTQRWDGELHIEPYRKALADIGL